MSTIKQRQEAHISRITKQGDHFQIRVRLASDYSEYETLISEEMVDASISSLYNRLGYQAVIDLPVLVDIDSDGHIYNIVGDIESFSLSQRIAYTNERIDSEELTPTEDEVDIELDMAPSYIPSMRHEPSGEYESWILDSVHDGDTIYAYKEGHDPSSRCVFVCKDTTHVS